MYMECTTLIWVMGMQFAHRFDAQPEGTIHADSFYYSAMWSV